jgi:hypothetical protein
MDGRRCGIGFGLGGDDKSGAPSPGADGRHRGAVTRADGRRGLELGAEYRTTRAGSRGPGKTNWVAYRSFFTYRWYLWVNNSELHV